MSKKGQYRKIPEFSLKFLVVITNVYPESTYWVQTLHGWILVTRMGYVFEEVQCRMNIQGFFPKIVKNFKRMTAEHEAKHEILLSEGTWWLHELYTHDAGLVCNTLVRNIFVFIFYIWRRKKSKLWKYYQPVSNVTDCELWIWWLKIVEPDLGTSTLNHCKRN